MAQTFRSLMMEVCSGAHAGLQLAPDEAWLLLKRLEHLPDGAAHVFEEACRDLFGVVEQASRMAGLRGGLATVLRRVTCVLDHLDAPGRLPALALVVRCARQDVGALLRGVCLEFAPLWDRRHVAHLVDVPASLPMDVDAAKLELVLLNLLVHATLDTPVGGRILVQATVDGTAGWVTISVTDSGPELRWRLTAAPAGHAPQLARGEAADVPVMGLGLGTMRDLLVLQGGSLHVHANPGGGACVQLGLPLRAPAGLAIHPAQPWSNTLAQQAAEKAERPVDPHASPAPHPLGLGAGPGVLLVVGALPSLQQVLVEGLEPEFQVASVARIEDAMAGAALAAPADLLILDVTQPISPWKTVLAAVQSSPRWSSTPVLAVIPERDPALEVSLLEHGVADLLRTPLLMPEARARIRTLVKGTQARAQLVSLVDAARHAAELAHRASVVKSSFLQMVSHEMKTPITALDLHLRMLEKHPAIRAQPQLGDPVERIRRSSARLLRLVETVLEWARVERGHSRVNVDDVDAAALLQEVLDEHGASAVQKNITLTLHAPQSLPCRTDRRLTRLLAMNLVGRAVQLTERGVVDVGVTLEPGMLCIWVRDFGPTIPAQERVGLFDPLGAGQEHGFQGGAASGLGLYVARDIARAMGADLALDPGQQPGNVFQLRIPQAATPATRHPQ